MQRFAYLIHRTDNGIPERGRRTMSYGTRITDKSPAELAAELIAENRVGHSYYAGPRRCWVWLHPDDTPLARTAPEGATPYDG